MPSKDVGQMLLRWAVLKTMGPDRWHLAHVADAAHTQFICEEIDAAVSKQRQLNAARSSAEQTDSSSDHVVVADIGAGLGLYALHASRQEGVRAVRCEAGPAMCKLAKAASIANIGDKGTFEVKCMSLYADSDDDVPLAVLPAPLGSPACVIVIDALHPLLSEATCQGLLGRGVFDAISSLQAAQLCDSRTIFVPACYVIHAALLYIPPGTCTELLTPPLSRVAQDEENDGFDVSLFNRFRAKTFEPAQLSFTHMSLVSHAVVIASIDLSQCARNPFHLDSMLQDRVVEFPICSLLPEAGVANGVCMWVDRVGDAGKVFSNAPCDANPRRQAVFMLQHPLPIASSPAPPARASFSFQDGRFAFDFVGHSDVVAVSSAAHTASSVQRWHFPMLQDVERNLFYHRAIATSVFRGAHVLDIGSGTGLLAMMAARAGAGHVTTCEKVKAVAECAAEIISWNKMSDICPVNVVPLLSNKLVVGEQLPAPVDVIVSEILDCGLLGEGMLPATAHALNHLAHPQAVIIPSSASVTAQLLYVPLQFAPLSWPLGSVPLPSGSADLSAYDMFRSPTYEQYRLMHLQHTKMSPPFHVFDFDFRQSDALLQGRQSVTNVSASQTGCVNCVCFWFRVQVGQKESVDTHPGNATTTWKQVYRSDML